MAVTEDFGGVAQVDELLARVEPADLLHISSGQVHPLVTVTTSRSLQRLCPPWLQCGCSVLRAVFPHSALRQAPIYAPLRHKRKTGDSADDPATRGPNQGRLPPLIPVINLIPVLARAAGCGRQCSVTCSTRPFSTGLCPRSVLTMMTLLASCARALWW